jgi:hypothetical protein
VSAGDTSAGAVPEIAGWETSSLASTVSAKPQVRRNAATKLTTGGMNDLCLLPVLDRLTSWVLDSRSGAPA